MTSQLGAVFVAAAQMFDAGQTLHVGHGPESDYRGSESWEECDWSCCRRLRVAREMLLEAFEGEAR